MDQLIRKENKDKSFTVNIPIPRVCSTFYKNPLKVTTRRKVPKASLDNRFQKQPSCSKYLLPEFKPLPVKHIKKDQILLSFRQFAKKEQKLRHKLRQTIKCWEEYRIRSTDLRKRLYIKSLPNDVTAITDIDKDYFTFISGRPLPRSILSQTSIKHFFNYRLLKKIEVGYILDAISAINYNIDNETLEYESSVKRLETQERYLHKFISDDYQKSMAALNKWEEVREKVAYENIELKNLATETFTITSRIICLDYIYTMQQKYGRFLYYLSPPTWRAHNRHFANSIEIQAKGFDLGFSEEDTFHAVYDKMKIECARLIKPALYFTLPKELMQIFNVIEMLQYNQFAHVLQMAPLLKLLHIGVSTLTDIVTQDCAPVVNAIETFKALIKFHSERCKQLEKKFYTILHGLFYRTVASTDVLKLFVNLGFCYEKVSNQKSSNLDILIMAKSIEKQYLQYQFLLEDMQEDSVNEAVKQCIRDEKIMEQRAKKASRELRLFERLEHKLQVDFAPAAKRENITKFEASVAPHPIDSKKTADNRRDKIIRNTNRIKITRNSRSLTEAEHEYLCLFTDWTETEDPTLYLHSPI